MDLASIKKVFDKADPSNGGNLTEKEFIEHFGELLGQSRDVDELKTLFAMIDANANQSIDWDEFSTHLLMGSEGNRRMTDDQENKQYLQPLPDKNNIGYHHKDMIMRIANDPKRNKYYTARLVVY
jgi:Ca2+-binding EF-hand superfamily protein